MKFVHAADLHLSASEADYSLSVLDAVVGLVTTEKARVLVLAGDIFDSFADLEALRGRFRAAIERIPAAVEVLAVFGNHEEHGRGGADPGRRDFGRMHVASSRPAEVRMVDGTEFLMVPYGPIDDYVAWKLPAKVCATRVAVVHGSVPGLTYTGPGEDESRVVDPDFFDRHDVDYAALGHIHGRKETRQGGRVLAYPGSTRIWRRGEEGPRGVMLVETEPRLSTRFVVVPEAGVYRRIEIPVEPDGSIDGLAAATAEAEGADWLDLELSGVVEDEPSFASLLEAETRGLRSRLRRLDINRDGVLVAEGFGSLRIARRFLEFWRAEEPPAGDPDARAVWLAARRLALEKLRETVTRR